MNGFVEMISDLIPKERDQRVKRIWMLIGLVVGTLAVSFAMMILIKRLQGVLASPLKEYALYAYGGVFFITVLNSATIIFPTPGMALVLAAANNWNPFIIAIVASIGGTLGEVTAYWVGRAGKNVILPDQSKTYKRAEEWTDRHGGWMFSLLAGVPLMPFDIVGLMAGGLKYPVGKFLFFCWLGRIPRTFIEVFFGAQLLRWIFHFFFR